MRSLFDPSDRRATGGDVDESVDDPVRARLRSLLSGGAARSFDLGPHNRRSGSEPLAPASWRPGRTGSASPGLSGSASPRLSGSESRVAAGLRPSNRGPRHARPESLALGRWGAEPLRTRWSAGRRATIAVIVALLLAAGVVGFAVWHSRPVLVPVSSATARAVGSMTPAPPSRSTAPAEIVVSVAGKVRHPGLVRLAAGARVADAIAAAGGLLPGADAGLLNIAKVLTDGEQIVVGMPAPTAAGAASSDGGGRGGPVNLNTASADQLEQLPGVGPATAQRIIAWREANGPFSSLDQLQEVPGIGPAKFADIAPKATI